MIDIIKLFIAVIVDSVLMSLNLPGLFGTIYLLETEDDYKYFSLSYLWMVYILLVSPISTTTAGIYIILIVSGKAFTYIAEPYIRGLKFSDIIKVFVLLIINIILVRAIIGNISFNDMFTSIVGTIIYIYLYKRYISYEQQYKLHV